MKKLAVLMVFGLLIPLVIIGGEPKPPEFQAVIPLGYVCQPGQAAPPPLKCADPAELTYLVLATPSGQEVTAFHYTITGFLLDGSPVNNSGSFERRFDLSTSSSLPIKLGGILATGYTLAVVQRIDLDQKLNARQ